MMLLEKLYETKFPECLYVNKAFKALKELEQVQKSGEIVLHRGRNLMVKVQRDFPHSTYTWAIHRRAMVDGKAFWIWRRYLIGPSAKGGEMKLLFRTYPIKYDRGGKYIDNEWIRPKTDTTKQ